MEFFLSVLALLFVLSILYFFAVIFGIKLPFYRRIWKLVSYNPNPSKAKKETQKVDTELYENEILDLKKENENLKEDITLKTEKITELKIENEDLKRQKEYLENENVTLKEENSSLTVKNNTLSNDKMELAREKGTLTTQVNKLKRDVSLVQEYTNEEKNQILEIIKDKINILGFNGETYQDLQKNRHFKRLQVVYYVRSGLTKNDVSKKLNMSKTLIDKYYNEYVFLEEVENYGI